MYIVFAQMNDQKSQEDTLKMLKKIKRCWYAFVLTILLLIGLTQYLRTCLYVSKTLIIIYAGVLSIRCVLEFTFFAYSLSILQRYVSKLTSDRYKCLFKLFYVISFLFFLVGSTLQKLVAPIEDQADVFKDFPVLL